MSRKFIVESVYTEQVWKLPRLCVISDFRRGVNEICGLFGIYTA
jgi:hypothetical protein